MRVRSSSLRTVALYAAAPLLAHLLFSWMGFSLLDGGLILAFSRRLLEGQIPHLDYIDVRPGLSAFVHLPLVHFGGDYVFWLSRLFVWLQFAAIAYAWLGIYEYFTQRQLTASIRYRLFLLGFLLTASVFPLIASYTLDGLFFCLLGFTLATNASARISRCGWMLCGAGMLCKQTFAPLTLLLLLLSGKWKSGVVLFATLLPSLLFAVYLYSFDGLSAAIAQVLSRSGDFYQLGIASYFASTTFLLGIAVGVALMGALRRGAENQRGAWLRTTAGHTLPLFPVAFALALPFSQQIQFSASFFVFGIACGVCAVLARRRCGDLEFALVVVIAGWCASLSYGVNTPILAFGGLSILLIALPQADAFPLRPPRLRGELVLLSLMTFVAARALHVYADPPLPKLCCSLEAGIEGSALIRTSEETQEYVEELRQVLLKYGDEGFVILPGIPAFWVASERQNLLSSDWVGWGEVFHNRALSERILQELKNLEHSTIVIVQRFDPLDFGDALRPFRRSNPLVEHVKQHFLQIEGTKNFEIYRSGAWTAEAVP